MLENLEKYKIILASNSPRRKELLSGLGIKYEVKTLPGIEETYPDTLKAEEIPLYIACEKAAAYRNTMHPDELIITADTIVWLDGVVMGKPHNEDDARQMLWKLSGKTHQVITGVCLTTAGAQRSFSAVTARCSMHCSKIEYNVIACWLKIKLNLFSDIKSHILNAFYLLYNTRDNALFSWHNNIQVIYFITCFNTFLL